MYNLNVKLHILKIVNLKIVKDNCAAIQFKISIYCLINPDKFGTF